jgi:hypothetical protein
MKGIRKKLRKSAPKRDNGVFKRYPVRVDIAFRAEMIEILFSVLLDNSVINTISTVMNLTVRANPLGWLGGMVMARCPHKTPSYVTFSSQNLAFRSNRSSANIRCVKKVDVRYYYMTISPIHQTQSLT